MSSGSGSLLGGLPHNGKMFGFYDPTDHALDSYTPPFNKKFLSYITKQRIDTRQAPVDAFKKYRKTCDPKGLFYTQIFATCWKVVFYAVAWACLPGNVE